MISPSERVRAQTRRFLVHHGITENRGLPLIEEHADLNPPSAQRVARRSLVLAHLIGGAMVGAAPEKMSARIAAHDLDGEVTPRERALLSGGPWTEQQKVNASWLSECAMVFAWGLGLVELDPFRTCDDDLASHFPSPAEPSGDFIAGARLRAFDEIYAQCDLYYCLHWAVREELHYDGAATGLDIGVIQERHRAINWLAGVEVDWDEVRTDT